MLAAHSSLRCELPLGRSAAMCRSQQPKALDPRPSKEKAQDPRRLLNFGAGNFCRCSRVCPLVRCDKRVVLCRVSGAESPEPRASGLRLFLPCRPRTWGRQGPLASVRSCTPALCANR